MNNPRRGVRDPPSFSPYMMHWRFEVIRRLGPYSKADMSRVNMDPWSWFRPAVEDFNAKRKEVIDTGMVLVPDESMFAYRPRKDKLGGLPNISFIQLKPKPLGKELKCVVDATTGVMTHLEIQEGRDAMRGKEYVSEMGVTTTCNVRLGERSGGEGHTMVGDSWFGSVKV